VCAERRTVQEGSSPSGAQVRGAVSKGGGNASLARESGRYGDPYTGTKAKAGDSQGRPGATVGQFSGGQGVHREMESEGHAEKYRAVIDGGYPDDEPVGQRWGKVESALWRRRRSHSPTAPRCVRTARYGRTARNLGRTGRVSGWHRRKRPYKHRAKWGVVLGQWSDSRIVPEARSTPRDSGARWPRATRVGRGRRLAKVVGAGRDGSE